jgi:hypothetical protein
MSNLTAKARARAIITAHKSSDSTGLLEGLFEELLLDEVVEVVLDDIEISPLRSGDSINPICFNWRHKKQAILPLSRYV